VVPLLSQRCWPQLLEVASETVLLAGGGDLSIKDGGEADKIWRLGSEHLLNAIDAGSALTNRSDTEVVT
jgi:hypothetical protein